MEQMSLETAKEIAEWSREKNERGTTWAALRRLLEEIERLERVNLALRNNIDELQGPA